MFNQELFNISTSIFCIFGFKFCSSMAFIPSGEDLVLCSLPNCVITSEGVNGTMSSLMLMLKFCLYFVCTSLPTMFEKKSVKKSAFSLSSRILFIFVSCMKGISTLSHRPSSFLTSSIYFRMPPSSGDPSSVTHSLIFFLCFFLYTLLLYHIFVH